MLLGTRLWYAFYDADEISAAEMEGRVDQVAQELGERGKLPGRNTEATTMSRSIVPEGVPTAETTALATTSPQSDGVRDGVVAHATLSSADSGGSSPSRVQHRDSSFTPSMQLLSPVQQQAASQQALAQTQQQWAEQALPVTELAALQNRFEELHAAKLLTDFQLFTLENSVADYAYLQLGSPLAQRSVDGESDHLDVPAVTHSAQLATVTNKLVKIHTAATIFHSQEAFARQLKRQVLDVVPNTTSPQHSRSSTPPRPRK